VGPEHIHSFSPFCLMRYSVDACVSFVQMKLSPNSLHVNHLILKTIYRIYFMPPFKGLTNHYFSRKARGSFKVTGGNMRTYCKGRCESQTLHYRYISRFLQKIPDIDFLGLLTVYLTTMRVDHIIGVER
jgi:hypothetical protein